MWKGCGTTANVGLIVYGEDGKTLSIPLGDANLKKTFFARGSVNNFTLCLPQSLGTLIKIAIWHDNSGRSPSWYLQQVVILDAENNEKYHFLGNRWLALERGSGKIKANIKVANKKQLGSFKNLFYSRTARSLGDGHLWLSLFTRPPHNPFTRCQRLSCCLSVLFAAMVTNAMFYQFGAAPGDTFQLGPLKLSWTQIKIGIQSSIIAIPVNVLVVMIFRNIKPNLDVYHSTSGSHSEKMKIPGLFPPFFVYVGWTLCLLTTLTAAAFTVFYSLMWGAEVSNQWLTSITISFLQDVVVTQPIKVVAIASVLSLLIKKPPEHDTVYGRPLKRDSKKGQGSIDTPRGEELEKAKGFGIKLRKMVQILLEIALFVLFICVLFVVVYGNRKTSRFMLTKAMRDTIGKFERVSR